MRKILLSPNFWWLLGNAFLSLHDIRLTGGCVVAAAAAGIRAGRSTASCPSTVVKLTATSGTIKSPGFDDESYPNNARCRWLIQAPAGHVSQPNGFAIIKLTID